MKTKSIMLISLLAGVCGQSFASDTAAAVPAGPRIEVNYVNPEKFTDFTDTASGSERGAEAYRALFKEYLETEAVRFVPQGMRLALAITDVDMAGDFEPWRGSQFSDIRIVKDLYPPRINFTYKITDASGAVVREGEEKVRDMNFQMSGLTSMANDSLRYEKALMDDWLRAQFPKAKKEKQSKAKAAGAGK
jgi:hypothetical protein